MSNFQKNLSSTIAKNDSNSYRALQIMVRDQSISKSSSLNSNRFKVGKDIFNHDVRFKWQTDKFSLFKINGKMKNYTVEVHECWDGCNIKKEDTTMKPVEVLQK
jgi:hypothetical protein